MISAEQKELLERLREERKKLMPQSAAVVQEALRRLDRKFGTADSVRRGFNAHLKSLFEETLKVLEESEARVDPRIRAQADISVTSVQYELLKGYFLSIANSRKQRGGKDFELQVQELLRRATIPFEAQARKERIDLLLPSREVFERDRGKGVIVSLKRTLRERWRQVVDELHELRCPNTYVVTAEERLSGPVIQSIFDRRLYLVVWDEVKAVLGNSRIYGFTEFVDRLVRLHGPHWP